MRAILSLACAFFTLPVFGLLAFSYVHPIVSILWLGVTYSFAAVSIIFFLSLHIVVFTIDSVNIEL